MSHDITTGSENIIGSENVIELIKKKYGLNLKVEWVNRVLKHISNTSLDDAAKADVCLETFLNCDMELCSNGMLPQNVGGLSYEVLPGPLMLQVDEIVDVSRPLHDRYKKNSDRTLKLCLTDGVQHVFGFECERIADLDIFSPAGLKVVIDNATVREGMIMLYPKEFLVVGGFVEELEAARLRVVTEVNKPPMDERKMKGPVPNLATRASREAKATGTTVEDVSSNK